MNKNFVILSHLNRRRIPTDSRILTGFFVSLRMTLSIVFFFFSTSSVYAASIVISDADPGTLTSGDQEYLANVTLSINADDGTKYNLGGVFALQGTTNYCGKTWNAEKSVWATYTDQPNLPVVIIASSSASIAIKARLDIEDSGCKSAGSYIFKVRRYTEGGSASFDGQNEQTVVVALPSATLTPTQTPRPTATPKPDPSNTPVPQSKPTESPVVAQKTSPPGKSPVHTEEYQPDISVDPTQRALRLAAPTETGEHEATTSILGVADNRSRKSNLLVAGLIGVGGVCIGSAGYMMIRVKRKI